MIAKVLWFHELWFFVALAATGLVGAWGLVLAALRRSPGRLFRIAAGAAAVAMLIQVGAGLTLYAKGMRPLDGRHVFYGVLIVVTFSFAYIYRSQFARRPALSYGLLLLFVMGLGFRAWSNVGT
ncbi:MAG: hypothetical protein ABFS21_02555 [Actinomycetota bacterium]